MISIYSPGDTHVWIPVAKETSQQPARAFLPFNGINATYTYGYKARPSKGTYFEALRQIQKAYIDNTSEVFLVKDGRKEERQYKAKWRHGCEWDSLLLGPANGGEGWVKLPVEGIEKITTMVVPVPCSADEDLALESERLRKVMGRGYPLGQKVPETIQGEGTRFRRDATVVAYVLNQAEGLCECCNAYAPFSKANGEPYLEVHHVKPLAEGGTDTITNAVALCPNCHRELHHGTNAMSFRKELYARIARLARE